MREKLLFLWTIWICIFSLENSNVKIESHFCRRCTQRSGLSDEMRELLRFFSCCFFVISYRIALDFFYISICLYKAKYFTWMKCIAWILFLIHIHKSHFTLKSTAQFSSLLFHTTQRWKGDWGVIQFCHETLSSRELEIYHTILLLSNSRTLKFRFQNKIQFSFVLFCFSIFK